MIGEFTIQCERGEYMTISVSSYFNEYPFKR